MNEHNVLIISNNIVINIVFLFFKEGGGYVSSKDFSGGG